MMPKQTNVKAYLIDPLGKLVTEISLPPTDDAIHRAIEADWYAPIQIGKSVNYFLVDEEGYLREKKVWWRLKGFNESLVNKAVVIGMVDAGFIDVTTKLDFIKSLVIFLED